jgi:hypothetical protein
MTPAWRHDAENPSRARRAAGDKEAWSPHVRRLLRLTLLAPEVIERLLTTPGMALEQVMRRPWPHVWADQVRELSHENRGAEGRIPG